MLTHAHSTRSLTHSLTQLLTHRHSLTRSLTHSLTLSHALTLTHTHSHALTLTHTHTLELTQALKIIDLDALLPKPNPSFWLYLRLGLH